MRVMAGTLLAERRIHSGLGCLDFEECKRCGERYGACVRRRRWGVKQLPWRQDVACGSRDRLGLLRDASGCHPKCFHRGRVHRDAPTDAARAGRRGLLTVDVKSRDGGWSSQLGNRAPFVSEVPEPRPPVSDARPQSDLISKKISHTPNQFFLSLGLTTGD
jgi:hypothetical protein